MFAIRALRMDAIGQQISFHNIQLIGYAAQLIGGYNCIKHWDLISSIDLGLEV